ncbi:MAG: sensor histidine kinase [Phormidesmis sp.]
MSAYQTINSPRSQAGMNRAIQLHNHPFRFLLYLEWGLLGVAILSTLDSPPARLGKGPLRDGLREGVREGVREGLRGEFREPGSGPARDALSDALLHGPPSWHHNPLLAITALVLFGLIGLYLPAKTLPKLGHTLGQFLLVLVPSATVLSDGRTFPFLYLILVIRGCLMYNLTGRLVLTGSAFALFIGSLLFRLQTLTRIGRRLPPDARDRLQSLVMGLQLNFAILFGLSLLLVVLLINALLTERQSQQRLQRANHTLRTSAQEIEKLAMDQERSRIARDIHDALGHSLTALNIQLESAVKLWEKDPAKAQHFLGNAKRLGTQSLQEVRESVAALRQDPLAGETLESAIAHLIANIQSNPTNQINISQQITLSAPLPNNLKILLYRIVQEGLTNIVKHARAQQVRLQLTSSAAIVTLNLEDNGQGFDVEQTKSGFGLQSMRDRAESVSGTFTVNSSTQKATHGTSVQVSLPIQKR